MNTQVSIVSAAGLYLLGFIVFVSGWCTWVHESVGIGTVTMIIGFLIWAIPLWSYSWYGEFV